MEKGGNVGRLGMPGETAVRQPKPYFKKSHNAWYANIGPNGRPVRLASKTEGEDKAYEEYHAKMAGRQPVDSDGQAAICVGAPPPWLVSRKFRGAHGFAGRCQAERQKA